MVLAKENILELITDSYQQIIEENTQIFHTIQLQAIAEIIPVIAGAKAVFVAGAGRSGIMLRAAAMRFMHAGLISHVVGDTTTPAIQRGEVLVVASGSGTTAAMVSIGQKAKKIGAVVILISIATQSPLTQIADYIIQVPAAKKQDHGAAVSKQYAGSLFEQSVLLITEVIFQTIWQQSGVSAETLWLKHANLE